MVRRVYIPHGIQYSMANEKILRWVCKDPKCKKKIISLYPKQLSHLIKQHELMHDFRSGKK